jgi:hypothetical protein
MAKINRKKNISVGDILLSTKIEDGELSWKGQPADYSNTNSLQGGGDDELLLKCRLNFFHSLDFKEISSKKGGDQADNDTNRANKEWVIKQTMITAIPTVIMPRKPETREVMAPSKKDTVLKSAVIMPKVKILNVNQSHYPVK